MKIDIIDYDNNGNDIQVLLLRDSHEEELTFDANRIDRYLLHIDTTVHKGCCVAQIVSDFTDAAGGEAEMRSVFSVNVFLESVFPDRPEHWLKEMIRRWDIEQADRQLTKQLNSSVSKERLYVRHLNDLTRKGAMRSKHSKSLKG